MTRPAHTRGVRSICVVVLLLVARVAAAQPVSFQLQGDVPVGKKPLLQVRAAQDVTDLKLELDRDDGKHFSARHARLAKGQAITLPIGDGAPGKAAYKGTLTVTAGASGPWTEQLTFDTLVRAKLAVAYDAEHLDLDKRVLQFKPSRAIASAELVVIGDDGKEIAKGAATYKAAPADGWHAITWAQPAGTRAMILRLRAVTAEGTASNVELIPWSVQIDHEEVTFATDSAVIAPRETAKLDASLAKIQDVVKRSGRYMAMKLYVAGHTDTVGASAKNRKLSLARARAIAAYFKQHGVTLPIAFAGFGEDVLKVKTGDNVDNATNRRADYVIGPAAGAPPFKGPYLRVRADWKLLR